MDDHNVFYTVIDIKEDHPDKELLRKLHSKSGLPLLAITGLFAYNSENPEKRQVKHLADVLARRYL